MLFQLLFSGLGNGLSGTGFLLVITALACVLGAEIACICVLISKLHRARKNKKMREKEDNYGNYAAGVLMMSAIPQSMYLALSTLAGLTALFAVVLVFLIILCRLMGYDFIPGSKNREESVHHPAEESRPSQPVYAVPTVDEASEEAQQQEQYTADPAITEVCAEEAPFEVFDSVAEREEVAPAEESVAEESDVVVAEEADTVAEEADAVAEAEENSEVSAEEDTVLAVVPGNAGEQQILRAEEAAGAAPVAADGNQPYRVVEKVVKETYKEVIKETSTTAPESREKSSTELLFEKMSDFLEYEMQRRKEMDAKAAEQGGSIPTFAKSVDPAEEAEEDEPDDEEDATLDEEDVRDEDDVDDEENDTEGDHFTGNERIIGFVEETGCYLVAHYRKSFEAKLIQAKPHIKKYYSELKNALLSYKGTKDRISWAADSFHNGRTPIAKINVKTRILELYLALDPATLEGTVYRGKDVGHKKKYADTPFQYKIRTPRKFKWAMELVQRTCEEHGLSPIDIEPVDYAAQYPFDTTDNLVMRSLIKEYIREEKPATTFELAPDHVPNVPDEDESVIPANANFSWEFDNDMLKGEEEPPIEEPVEEPVEEPAEEPVVQPEPQPEPAPATQKEVVRETVKVTEVHYTERYYGDGTQVYSQTVTAGEPIEAIAEPVAEVVAEESVAPAAEIVEAEPVVEETVTEEPVAEEAVEEISEEAEEEMAEEPGKERFFEEFYTDVASEVTYAPTQEEESVEEPEEAEAVDEERFFDETDEPAVAEEVVEEVAEEEPVEEEYVEETAEGTVTEEDYAEEEPEDTAAKEEYTEEEPVEEEIVEEIEEEVVEEVVEEAPAPVREEPITYPFRPSFYANRNYDDIPDMPREEEPAEEEPAEEEYAEEDRKSVV